MLAEIAFSVPVNLTGSSSGLSRAETRVARGAGSGLASLPLPAAAAARGGLSPAANLSSSPPEGWSWCYVGDVPRIQYGERPRSGAVSCFPQRPPGSRLLRPSRGGFVGSALAGARRRGAGLGAGLRDSRPRLCGGSMPGKGNAKRSSRLHRRSSQAGERSEAPGLRLLRFLGHPQKNLILQPVHPMLLTAGMVQLGLAPLSQLVDQLCPAPRQPPPPTAPKMSFTDTSEPETKGRAGRELSARSARGGEAGAGEGAGGTAGAVPPPEELAFHVPSGKTASAWLQQRGPAVVACFLFSPCIFSFLGIQRL